MDEPSINPQAEPHCMPTIVVNTNSVYITHSIVMIHTSPPHSEENRFLSWLDAASHVVKTSGVKIAIVIAGMLAIWGFVRYEWSRNIEAAPLPRTHENLSRSWRSV
jgi:hypothetical protein